MLWIIAAGWLLRPSHRLHLSVDLRHKLGNLLTRLRPTRRANMLQEHEQRFVSSLLSLEWRRPLPRCVCLAKDKAKRTRRELRPRCLKSIFICTWPRSIKPLASRRGCQRNTLTGNLRVCVKATEPLSSAAGKSGGAAERVASPERSAGANLWGN